MQSKGNNCTQSGVNEGRVGQDNGNGWMRASGVGKALKMMLMVLAVLMISVSPDFRMECLVKSRWCGRFHFIIGYIIN